jgi:DNA-binding response OmpR family regulator
VEDEKILGSLVVELIHKRGHEVKLVTNGGDALQAYRQFKPHLCLLDIMLPGKDGFEVARQLRAIDSAVPILFLTAKVDAADVVNGFNAGCNDYIRKPFNSDELLVRIDHWLKEKYRQLPTGEMENCMIGNAKFSPIRQVLETAAGNVELTHKETALLSLLYANRNNIVARDFILQKVWNNETGYNSRTLDVYINRLRKYLEKTSSQIVTLKGIGYRFICEE